MREKISLMFSGKMSGDVPPCVCIKTPLSDFGSQNSEALVVLLQDIIQRGL
jgi:hypothetical protein